MLVSSIYGVEICPESAKGGEKILGFGAVHLRSEDDLGPILGPFGGKCRRFGGLGAFLPREV